MDLRRSASTGPADPGDTPDRCETHGAACGGPVPPITLSGAVPPALAADLLDFR